jgi:hypothetical protein
MAADNKNMFDVMKDMDMKIKQYTDESTSEDRIRVFNTTRSVHGIVLNDDVKQNGKKYLLVRWTDGSVTRIPESRVKKTMDFDAGEYVYLFDEEVKKEN